VKFVVGHGQMAPTQLEDVMSAFYEGQYDVLLSTTIVESGLDIPTANTLIIHRADMFGLAQLYQLRGRVGRSKARAFAYMTTPAERQITLSAERRLKVLQSLDSLGAGFQLASHDLDIRGGGNLLGEEQSGHIREIGVELYQQMLEDAVNELRARAGAQKDTSMLLLTTDGAAVEGPAAAIFPRPTAGALRPVVRGQTVKYNLRRRAGRGFTLAELKEAGVPAKAAPGIGIAVDHRRRNRSLESLQDNVARLKAYKASLVVFPRKAGKAKAGDTAEPGAVAQAKGALLPITRAAPALASAPVDATGPRAYYTLRLERTNARLAGMRKKRIEDAEAEEKNAAK
jgi:ribosomal protein L13E